MTMVERVADALRRCECEHGCIPEIAARTAIEAMREPTQPMRAAGYQSNAILDPDREAHHHSAEPAWQAMIDAALAEDERAPDPR